MVFKDLNLTFDLPSHVRNPHIISKERLELVQKHFMRCVSVHFCGGDIGDEYPQSEINDMQSALGIDEDSYDPIPLDDEKWQSPLGQEIMRALFEESMDKNDILPYSNSDHELEGEGEPLSFPDWSNWN